LTEYIVSVMVVVIDGIQRQREKDQGKLKPVKISIPINLRQFYPTNTMRNFASYVNLGVEPRYGKYSFDEVLSVIHHYMKIEVTEKMLNAKFSTNVRSENRKVLRVTPLILKNAAMKYTYKLVGERKTSLGFSNLGVVRLPEQMSVYITRMDFIQGKPSQSKISCAGLTYNGNLIINFTRSMKESVVEREFFRYLIKLGIPVRIESNQQW